MSSHSNCGYPTHCVRAHVDASVIFIASIEGDDEVMQPFPAKRILCAHCNGRGTHTNPAIDSNGLDMDFASDDEGFLTDYADGRYDVLCHCCDGARVMLVPATAEGEIALATVLREDAEISAIHRAERAMGA